MATNQKKKKDEEPKKVRRSTFGRQFGAYYVNPIRRGFFNGIRGIIGIILCFILGYILLSGYVNQGQVARDVSTWYTETAAPAISQFMEDLFNGESSFFSIGKDGIYFKDSVPEGANQDPLFSEGSSSDTASGETEVK